MNNANAWLRATCGDDSFREIARRSGLSDSIISRQLAAGSFGFDVALAIAREYGTSPISALVANGHLTEAEAGIDSAATALQAATDEQLVVELGRRLDVTPSSMIWDAPVSEAVAKSEATVHYPDFSGDTVDDGRAVASDRSDDNGEDTGYDD